MFSGGTCENPEVPPASVCSGSGSWGSLKGQSSIFTALNSTLRFTSQQQLQKVKGWAEDRRPPSTPPFLTPPDGRLQNHDFWPASLQTDRCLTSWLSFTSWLSVNYFLQSAGKSDSAGICINRKKQTGFKSNPKSCDSLFIRPIFILITLVAVSAFCVRTFYTVKRNGSHEKPWVSKVWGNQEQPLALVSTSWSRSLVCWSVLGLDTCGGIFERRWRAVIYVITVRCIPP